MIVRVATEADAGGIADIWNHVIRETTATFTTEQKSAATVRDLIAEQPTWVAQSDSELAGFATLAAFRKGPGYARTGEHSIYVAPDFQGHGTARGLLDALQEGARQRGLRTLVAAIGGEAEASLAFHDRMGFVEVGRLPGVGQKFDRRQDLILMQKSL